MLIIRKIGIITTKYLTYNTLGKFSTIRSIVNIEQPKERLVLFTISPNIIKASHREKFSCLSTGKLNTFFTKIILRFSLCLSETSLRLSKTSLRLCRINLRFNQITLFLQILLHFLRNFFISN